MNYPTYTIETVEDFLKVPEDRLPICLSEFASFLTAARSMQRLAQIAGEAKGLTAEECRLSSPAFVWIDDGTRNATVSLSVKAKEE